MEPPTTPAAAASLIVSATVSIAVLQIDAEGQMGR
jgi:hypothetical protein